MRIPAFLVATLTLFAGASPAFATDDAVSVVNDLANRAQAMRDETQLTPADRRQRFRALLAEDFDFGTISRLVLGRFWENASETERQQFVTAFESYVVQVYAERFKDFAGTDLKVTRERADGASAMLVSTDMVQDSGAPPLKIDWRVGRADGVYKIIDISVAGVSMTEAQREEFSSIIQRNGGEVSSLIRQLRAKTLAASSP